MICLRCGHYMFPDREMAREQQSDRCKCACHRPLAGPSYYGPDKERPKGEVAR